MHVCVGKRQRTGRTPKRWRAARRARPREASWTAVVFYRFQPREFRDTTPRTPGAPTSTARGCACARRRCRASCASAGRQTSLPARERTRYAEEPLDSHRRPMVVGRVWLHCAGRRHPAILSGRLGHRQRRAAPQRGAGAGPDPGRLPVARHAQGAGALRRPALREVQRVQHARPGQRARHQALRGQPGQLWVGTETGVVLVTRQGKVTPVNLGPGAALQAVCEDANGAVWLYAATANWRATATRT